MTDQAHCTMVTLNLLVARRGTSRIQNSATLRTSHSMRTWAPFIEREVLTSAPDAWVDDPNQDRLRDSFHPPLLQLRPAQTGA